jgi:hypothetical protein
LIKYLILNKRPYIWILIHLLLGISATITPFGIIAWFYLVFFTSIVLVAKRSKSPFVILALILYLLSFELLARMAFTSPFIPYELGKYMLTIGMIWCVIRFKTFGYIGWIMLLCLIPALFFDLSGEVQTSDLIFNIFGPLNVALVVIFFYKQRLTQVQLGKMVRLMVYPILGVMSYTFLKTPSYTDVEFVLGGSLNTSGGFGANQVSTLFGLAALFMFILMINRWKFSGNYIVDGIILFAFTFQGLLTFSRGGMIGTALGTIVIILFLRLATPRQRWTYKLPKIGKFAIPAILIVISAFIVVDELSGGNLSLRYQGETTGTMAGSKVKSFNTVTTGRFDIFMGDLDLWQEHFLFGVGAGASRFLRQEMNGILSHVELSRLLAEHGVFGLIYFVLLCYLGFRLLASHPNPLIRGVLLAFFLVAIYTSFHAAMRTYVTPALVGLSLLSISNPNPKRENIVLRKQTKKPRLQPHHH